jgi:FAD/FMN-containing dehydrogenase
MEVQLSGWGRHPFQATELVQDEELERGSQSARLSRGLGRAYGDAALPAAAEDQVLSTTLATRILHFDAESGVLRAEAGLSLGDLYRVFLPRGFFTPDIHGKNHHLAGTFGRHVRALKMRVGDGRVLACSRTEHADLFFATLGGMGLTGHVLEVEVTLERVESPWIYEESERWESLEDVFAGLRSASATWPMTVAWIDTSSRGPRMGRGIVMRGRWATAEEAPAKAPRKNPQLRVPFDFPSGLVNPATISVMNRLWHVKHPNRLVKRFVAPESFFWILDSVNEWNRVFGRRGFMQYQCVLPSSAEIFRGFLARFQELGACSFVTVLKDCGEQGEGMLSFPKLGSTIAVDIPLHSHEHGLRMTAAFNEYVLSHGGRVYLAKDAFTTREHLAAMYPRLAEFQAVRKKYDPEQRLRSALDLRCL